MPEPRSLEEWAGECAHKPASMESRWQTQLLCQGCVRAYAEQETTSQKLQIAVLIRLLERVRDAEDPEEYLDDVAAADESTLAEESRVFLRERDALLIVARAAALFEEAMASPHIRGLISVYGNPIRDALAHPDVQRLIKERD